MVVEVPVRGFSFRAWGHVNVRATHRGTFEITREDFLTPRGDCIIGVKSEAAAADIPRWFIEAASSDDSVIVAVLCSGGVCDSVVGWGSPLLSMSDPVRMVFRRSSYVGPETVMVRASKSALDLRRDLVSRLSKGLELNVTLMVYRLA